MQLIDRFADLVVRAGVNVQPGQLVVVRADTAHLEIARAVARRAYEIGASWVETVWTDGPIRRAAVDHATLDTLTATPKWVLERLRHFSEQGVASIGLLGEADPSLFDGADPIRAAAFPAEEQNVWRTMMLTEGHRWTVVGAPNPGWATQVYGEPDVDRLWEAVGVAMRLDTPDPVAAWQERSATLGARGAQLEALQLTSLRFVGEGTDLTVGLIPGCTWTGGGMIDPHGVPYLPNIPTEEVFTSPDRHQAEGVIRLTKPVVIAGQLVTGLTAVFSGGRIVSVSADSGAAVVEAQLGADAGARSLGEVALVDRDSRIARAGVVFHNTLFDENAGCHVAWGQSFPFAFPGGSPLLNVSGVHTDVVIGGSGLSVFGSGPGGSVCILRSDEWVL
jgi:aminopeptidase